MSTIPEADSHPPTPPAHVAGPPAAAASTAGTRLDRAGWIIMAALVIGTVLAYARIGDCGFVNIDDDAYVEQQPMVNRGIHSAAVAWAFTASHSGTWHPLASLSHALDCDLFGVRARPMHWENVVIHALNAVLVFLLWRRVFGGLYRAAFVAALFALHPINVESVAWISERKNVLSTFFWLLGLAAYLRYAAAPSWQRYTWLAVVFAFGLLAKPMLVTFPCGLLLLDWWPLGRWRERGTWWLIREKLPLFVLTVGVSAATIVAQASTGATDYGHRFTLAARMGNAVVSYARYLGKAVWPESLSVFYFHPGYWPLVQVAAALALLLAVSVVAWRQLPRRPWFAWGWLWFLGTLVPVIGIVQSGAQALADRYAYIPLLGIFTIAAFAGAEFLAKFPHRRPVLIAAAAAALIASFALTRRQVTHWKNSGTLYEHSIAVGEDNPAVRFLYASHLIATGRPEEQITAQYRRALELQPDYVNAMTQLAVIALAHGRTDEARALIERSIQCEPSNSDLRFNLGSFFLRTGRVDDAVRTYQQVLALKPRSPGAHHELGQIYANQGRYEAALAEYGARAHLDKWNADAQCDYGILLGNLRRFEESAKYLNRALWLLPDHARARQGLEALSKLAPVKP